MGHLKCTDGPPRRKLTPKACRCAIRHFPSYLLHLNIQIIPFIMTLYGSLTIILFHLYKSLCEGSPDKHFFRLENTICRK